MSERAWLCRRPKRGTRPLLRTSTNPRRNWWSGARPARSIMNFAGVDRVFIVENNTVAERIVKLGRRLANDSIEVVSGLKPGDLLIAEPSDRLSVGQAVEVSRF